MKPKRLIFRNNTTTELLTITRIPATIPEIGRIPASGPTLGFRV